MAFRTGHMVQWFSLSLSRRALLPFSPARSSRQTSRSPVFPSSLHRPAPLLPASGSSPVLLFPALFSIGIFATSCCTLLSLSLSLSPCAPLCRASLPLSLLRTIPHTHAGDCSLRGGGKEEEERRVSTRKERSAQKIHCQHISALLEDEGHVSPLFLFLFRCLFPLFPLAFSLSPFVLSAAPARQYSLLIYLAALFLAWWRAAVLHP